MQVATKTGAGRMTSTGHAGASASSSLRSMRARRSPWVSSRWWIFATSLWMFTRCRSIEDTRWRRSRMSSRSVPTSERIARKCSRTRFSVSVFIGSPASSQSTAFPAPAACNSRSGDIDRRGTSTPCALVKSTGQLADRLPIDAPVNILAGRLTIRSPSLVRAMQVPSGRKP